MTSNTILNASVAAIAAAFGGYAIEVLHSSIWVALGSAVVSLAAWAIYELLP